MSRHTQTQPHRYFLLSLIQLFLSHYFCFGLSHARIVIQCFCVVGGSFLQHHWPADDSLSETDDAWSRPGLWTGHQGTAHSWKWSFCIFYAFISCTEDNLSAFLCQNPRSQSKDSGGKLQITWDNPKELEVYITKLQSAAEKLSTENRKLRKWHTDFIEKVVVCRYILTSVILLNAWIH